LKEEIEKRLGFREKNQNVGLQTPCATSFTPQYSRAPSREFNWKDFNYSLSILFIELSLYIGTYKVNFPITTDVGLNLNKRNN